MNIIVGLCWLFTLLGACAGAFLLFAAMNAEAAPAQGAAAAVACGFAIIPYVFTRAIESMGRKPNV